MFGLFNLLSHFIGQHSDVVPSVNIALEMSLNAVLAIVCMGYISTLLLFIFPFMPIWAAVSTSVVLLLSALPFEFLNAKVQNDSHKIKKDKPSFSIAVQIFMTISSILGGIQYLIRNYNLVFNFATSATGQKFITAISVGGYVLTAANFAIIGGISGLLAHALLSYRNWDKYTDFFAKDNKTLKEAKILWGALLVLVLYNLQIPLYPAGYCFAGLVMVRYLVPSPLFKRTTWQNMKEKYFKLSVFTLPMGAFLYALVDFFNSYAIIQSLGWYSPAMLFACGAFGLLSYTNTILVWGYNTVRFKHEGIGKKVDANSWFVWLYYADPSVRRLSIYVKETLLCGLDVLNNRLVLSAVNTVILAVFGLSINLMALNICTICYALNKIVIMKFQSGEDTVEYLTNANYKTTKMAIFCQGVLSSAHNRYNTAEFKTVSVNL